MKLISWNVNGIRAILKKPDLTALLREENPDVLCLQETKARAEQVELPEEFKGYHAYWNSADKPGYSGTAIFSKIKPLSVEYDLGSEEHDKEGRVITLEFEGYYLTTVYTPNSQSEFRRLEYRGTWDAAFLAKMIEFNARKPVIFCGDLNVAHQEIDLARPKQNKNKTPGFSDQERAAFDAIQKAGFIDTFRLLQPNSVDRYSWWSYRAGARGKNIGWRIDYFCVAESLSNQVVEATILDQVMGSDHCPVSMILATSA